MVELLPGKAAVLKPLILKAYEEFVLPKLEELVESTENPFDDHAVKIVDQIVRYFL